MVALGEFGRTPKIGLITQNGMTEKTGRDHWPHAFTALLAGGGVRGGQAYGSTTSTGGYVLDNPVSPADLTATILYHPRRRSHDDLPRSLPARGPPALPGNAAWRFELRDSSHRRKSPPLIR